MLNVKNDKLKSGKRIKILIGLLSVLFIVILFPEGESIESEVNVGSIWIHEDLIAPFSFAINKDADIYAAEIKAVSQQVLPIYTKEGNAKPASIDSLKLYNRHITFAIDSIMKGKYPENYNPTFLTNKSFAEFRALKRAEKYETAKKYASLSEVLSFLEKIISTPYYTEIYDAAASPERDSISVRIKNEDVVYPRSKFLSLPDAKKMVSGLIEKRNYPLELKIALIEYVHHFVYADLIYNKEYTSEELAQVKKNVSRFSGIVNENERIIAKHDRVTKETKLKIDSYRNAKGEKTSLGGRALQFLGKFLHISLLLSLLVIYLFSFRKKIYHDNDKLLLLAINITFLALITYIINSMPVNAPIQYLIFIPSASMILTMIFDSRVGFYSTVIIALITGALRGNDYAFAAAQLMAGGLSVYTVRDIKNRNQIFRSLTYIFLGYAISIVAFGLERFASVQNIVEELSFAAINSLVSPILTYGLMIFFERIFRITTDLTLVELSSFDRPLLKELARRAPGTFNHSMTMGTLAEAAAEEIGANPLLARVGAYYHDIGKIVRPHNFVENQLDNKNIHEELAPEESVELIKRHIQEGVNLAKDNNLPVEIVSFIPMHHGTTVMSFFYDKALKLYGENVNMKGYRYSGPKPNTKETAIVMLADGCESAVRSIDKPDAAKVENIINNIFKVRIEDRQLDESPLTFSDIDKIKDIFSSILLGQHHKRIRYPSQDDYEKSSEEPKI